MKRANKTCPACDGVTSTWKKEFPRKGDKMVDIYQCDKCSTQWMESRVATAQEIDQWFKPENERKNDET